MTQEQIDKLVSDVESGDANPMEAFGRLKTLADKFSEAANQVKEAALREAIEGYRVDEDKVTVNGFVFSHVKLRSQYNYKGISSWVSAEKEKKRIEELAKMAAKQNVEIVDQETGEVIPPCIVTYTKEGLSVKVAE